MRGNEIALDGDDDVERVARLLEDLVVLVEQGHRLDPGTVRRSVEMVRADERPAEVLSTEVLRPPRGRPVRPKSSGQKRYVDAMRENVITFGVGPAGTGKSWLAVAMAVQALQAKEVDRIILTRPAVEAGERLGFLPGDLMAKVDPYLRPLWDALHDMVGTENAAKLLERGAVEVAPLAFMRGRTLNQSFIILDEAQNTTPEQMKMFLTRIGFGSKAVVTGDTTQVDVAGGRSGLGGLERILDGDRRLGVGAPHEPRRGAPPHRAGHRRRLRAGAPGRADPLMAAGEPPEGPDKPDPDDLPEGVDPEDLPPMPMTTRKRRPPAEGEVEVFGVDEQHDQPVELARWVDLATAALLDSGVRGEAELSLLFVDEEVMADLNQRFMGADGPTDVLAFPLEDPIDAGRWPDSGSTGPDREPPEVGELPMLLGDVVVCPAVAARQAPEHAGSYDDEVALLVVHGVLHVLGMDHADPEEAAVMQARERELLDRYHHAR